MKRVAIYARVSTTDQTCDNQSESNVSDGPRLEQSSAPARPASRAGHRRARGRRPRG